MRLAIHTHTHTPHIYVCVKLTCIDWLRKCAKQLAIGKRNRDTQLWKRSNAKLTTTKPAHSHARRNTDTVCSSEKCKKNNTEEEKTAFAFSFVLHSQTYASDKMWAWWFSFDDKRITYAAQNCPQLSMHNNVEQISEWRAKKTKIVAPLAALFVFSVWNKEFDISVCFVFVCVFFLSFHHFAVCCYCYCLHDYFMCGCREQLENKQTFMMCVVWKWKTTRDTWIEREREEEKKKKKK